MRKLTSLVLLAVACLYAAHVAESQELRVPAQVTANAGATLQTSGNGEATFYLSGPTVSLKKAVKLGEEIALAPEDVRSAGQYIAVLRVGDNSVTRAFFVTPAQPATLNFLARPSRVPVARPGVISGVAFVFDDYKNLAIQPTTVTFNLSVGEAAPLARQVQTRYGIAWTKLDSGSREGAAQFVASAGGTSVRRVVQQTASDPCNLRFRAQPSKLGILVETDPVRDCTGNAVPDGTIVTFTAVEGQTRSTVDARIKRGVARAELPASQNAILSVASGVVMGNEVHWAGGR